MKKEYVSPEIDVLSFKLSHDILGDSKPQSTDVENYGDPIDDLFG